MAQTLREIEIICVDDGSSDRSIKTLKALAREDARIRLIRHDHNRGLGSARNSGIRSAQAEYVTGIDSDDHIRPEMMASLWQASDDGTADIVACGLARVHADGTPAGPSYQPQQGRYSNNNRQLDIFEFFNPSFCNKIWRRTLFWDHNIFFPEGVYFEDLAVMPRLMHAADDIRVISGDFYQYHIRAGSITNSYSFKHIFDHFKVFEILEDFLLRENLMERYGKEFIERMRRSLSFHAGNVLASQMSEKEKEQYLRFALILLLGYLQNKPHLQNASPETLRSLIETAGEGVFLARSMEEPRQ